MVVAAVYVAVLNTTLCADQYLNSCSKEVFYSSLFNRSSDILLVISCYTVRM